MVQVGAKTVGLFQNGSWLKKFKENIAFKFGIAFTIIQQK